MNDDLLSQCHPSEKDLWDWLNPRIDETMLEEMAKADYGEGFERHYEALKDIDHFGMMPKPLDWYPKEVLELIRWSEPDEPGWEPGGRGIRGHLMRAWVCAILLRLGVEPENFNYIAPINYSMVQLIASLIRLGREASQPGLQYLAWCYQKTNEGEYAMYDEDLLFYLLGILLLIAHLWEDEENNELLLSIHDRLMDEENKKRQRMARHYPKGIKSEKLLLGITCDDLRHNVWEELTFHCLCPSGQKFPEPLALTLQRTASKIGGKTQAP